MRIHFIAIGGAAMHNLALALHENGHQISGSDDEVFEPSRSRLEAADLLPENMGWHPEKISDEIDLIILGMHARKDNPELQKAQEIGLEINSYPEFLYNQSKEKKRVVIAGSHGKTSTTSMVLHVLKKLNMDFDYMVGAQIRGFERMVKLSDAPLIILEGDEYFSSPIDMKAKFLWYKPHLAVITGIAWDHINVYPTKEKYEECFEDFINSLEEKSSLFYYQGDGTLNIQVKFGRDDIKKIPYNVIDHEIVDNQTYVESDGHKVAVNVFGNHNLENMEAAKLISEELGISNEEFIREIADFEGAANRLELIGEGETLKVYKDFAHSPSKLKATVSACKNQFKESKLLAVMELHTFSSLNTDFLKEYQHSMDEADTAVVYFSPETIAHKKLKAIEASDIRSAFANDKLVVITDSNELQQYILDQSTDHEVILLMSSGNFNGIETKSLAEQIISRSL